MWTVSYQPNWDNLVVWLNLFHSGEMARYTEFDTDHDRRHTAVLGVFSVVHSHRGHLWTVVEGALPGLRQMLTASDSRWGEIEEASDEEDEDML